MRRFGLCVSALLLVALGAGQADEQRAEAARSQRPLVDVLVVLKAQEDVGAIRERKRADRVVSVVQALRKRASASQKGLVSLLKRRKAEGAVATVVPLWIIDAIEVKATPAVIAELASRPEVETIRPNVSIQAPAGAGAATSAEANLALVNAPALWDLGYRGQGVVVASMDTGVDVTHPDLALRWRGGTNSWYDPNGEHPTTPTDVNGHGTQTMGVIVGGNAGGSSVGMAPDSTWIAVKIFDDRGAATAATIHQGFQWLLDPDGDPSTADAPNVVNDSWTMTTGCDLEFELDLENLRAAGILPIFAAGNYGPDASSGVSPADNPGAFAVGATDDSDALAPMSSRGPVSCDSVSYPEIVAPGVDIHTTDLYGLYADSSGTSLSAPHVAGALALLLSAFPNLTADRQGAALETGAVDLGPAGLDTDYGFGRLDALAAYDWLSNSPDFAVSASPTSLNAVAGETATYSVSVSVTGGFSGDVSLDLGGLPPSKASWMFSPSVVEGGAGSSELVLNLAPDLVPGTYPLTISGTSGGVSRASSVTLVVAGQPDFAVAATPASATVTAGSGTSYSVSVSSLNGFADDVALAVSGLPAGASAQFSPAIVRAAGSSQLTIATEPSAAPGTYALTVSGSAGSRIHEVVVTLVIRPCFTLRASPSRRSVLRGHATHYSVWIKPQAGFRGRVTLSASGTPEGVTTSFSRDAIRAPETARLNVRVAGRTRHSTYKLTIKGVSAGLHCAVTVALIVR